MTIDEIETLADRDMKIDQSQLDHESLKTPSLHNTYLKIFSSETLKLKKMRVDFDELYKARWVYYSGKASAEEYKAEPFELKVLRADLEVFLNADKKLNELKLKIEIQTTKVKYLEELLKGINNRNWNIRCAVDFKKFISGVS